MLPPKLAQDFIVNAFRRLAEMRRWSWMVKFSQFIAPQVYSTGTIAVTNGSTTVTGTSTVWTASMVGRQFRTGLASPIYTIATFNSATSMDLDTPFGGPTATGSSYAIYQCYFTPPDDFHQFITVWDPSFNWQLMLDIDQKEINIWDAQRSNTGNAFVVSFRGYTSSQVGVVSQPLTVSGSGSVPVTGGVFSGPSDATFTIEITTTGASGTAVFKWKKNSGSYTTGVTTDSLGAAQSLMDGVSVSFPTGQTYTIGNIFNVNCTAISNAGLPFYEIWPHQQAQHVYPFLYEMRAKDLDDVNAVLPRYIRGDVLVDMAMAEVCTWPGASPDKPNPYFSVTNAAYHERKVQGQIQLLEVQDDNVWQQDFAYAYPSMLWGFATPLGDAAWLQSHAI
jgi:hypothetical protein